MQLKRLWDITTKQMVFVKGPTGHECQLWVDEATEKTYYYDMAQWLEYTQSAGNDGRTYGPTWKVVDSDDEMGVYDTDEPTELFTWESGDQVSYVFKDWDGTVLKEGKVKEGTKPTAPADPTRAATAQYTYTFAGWNPEVAKITKKTTYTATYTATVNEYTVTIASNNTDYGTVSPASVANVPYGTAITVENNELTIGEGTSATTVTATAAAGCEFSGWGELPATVTSDLSVTATFSSVVPPVSFTNHVKFSKTEEMVGDDLVLTNTAKIFFETGVSETDYIEYVDDGSVATCTFNGDCDTEDFEELFAPEEQNLSLTIVSAAEQLYDEQVTELVFTSAAWALLEAFFAGTATAQQTFAGFFAITESEEARTTPGMCIVEAAPSNL